MTAILRVTDLCVSAGAGARKTALVENVSFSVGKGRVLAIVGESGSGKSMTAHSIVQLLPEGVQVDAGSIVLDPEGKSFETVGVQRYGRAMRHVRSSRVGMIFQDSMSALNPVHSVGDQVAEGFRQHRGCSKKDAQKAVIEIFEQLGIPDPEQRYRAYPHQFSGGMRQRVMIAMALIREPELVIADEPTTALDMTIQQQVMAKFTELTRRLGTSVILITHNMGLVAQYSDDVVVMRKGRIVENGTTREVLTRPQHPYTQALIASVPTLDMDPNVPLATVSDFMDDSNDRELLV